ncbi:hypothetical protein AA0521_0972 [Komagataeibacter intermedius NRIC 0521]|uniref:Uncharacterized protein n=1 Tax=Komagataeibacter intermedius NRIC 0521 TaxID=1307934 RepID=A0ABQ0PG73_9PROT|nr:hypothetical protein AA0521_0972 [Komagataeibacter intermedius NRIC 0521]
MHGHASAFIAGKVDQHADGIIGMKGQAHDGVFTASLRRWLSHMPVAAMALFPALMAGTAPYCNMRRMGIL